MKLARGERVEPERLVGFLVIGNGSHDEKLVRALLSLYDHEKVVLAPQDRPALGLEGSIALAAELISRFRRDVLIVIDGEGFDGERFSALVEQYFSSSRVEKQHRKFSSLKVARGAGEAHLHVAVVGDRRIEEVEAALVRELYGERVKPEKKAIRDFLRRRGKRIYDLIKEASEEQLKKAFPPDLIELLKQWSRQCP